MCGRRNRQIFGKTLNNGYNNSVNQIHRVNKLLIFKRQIPIIEDELLEFGILILEFKLLEFRPYSGLVK